jgi:hypothetical protein
VVDVQQDHGGGDDLADAARGSAPLLIPSQTERRAIT